MSRPISEGIRAGSQVDYKDVLLLAALYSQKPFFDTSFADPF
ncbi:hypothetical protein PGH26_08675 [Sporosarcina jeotgali]|uniref:Uncharacterized protein n=1 Tax=Sporosarcina jeotgali TaxID=3020056 RepID=A0ABZ0KS15_9BACL|nr:hypothetical protein [Sporosarcina sp. B2O-1]WOV83016.1 hypothetical protein PGH26_08675 [Sporosarcina sp. B2O-1]